MKKLISAAVLSIGIAASAPASAVIVGGIDFGVLGQSPFNVAIETATLAETFVNGVGQTLQGYGTISTMNGDATYCANNTANCSLNYYFHDYVVTAFDGAHVTFTGGIVDIYYSSLPAANLFNQNSAANVAAITAMTPWARMVGHTFFDPAFLAFNPIATLNGGGTLTGASLTQTGQGMLDVVNGWGDASVESYLGRNTAIPDNLGGFGDVVLTSSSNNLVINPFDMFSPLGNSCRDPRTGPEVGDWCLQGTLNARGVVPEPGTLALLGLGLFGFGALRRRKQA